MCLCLGLRQHVGLGQGCSCSTQHASRPVELCTVIHARALHCSCRLVGRGRACCSGGVPCARVHRQALQLLGSARRLWVCTAGHAAACRRASLQLQRCVVGSSRGLGGCAACHGWRRIVYHMAGVGCMPRHAQCWLLVRRHVRAWCCVHTPLLVACWRSSAPSSNRDGERPCWLGMLGIFRPAGCLFVVSSQGAGMGAAHGLPRATAFKGCLRAGVWPFDSPFSTCCMREPRVPAMACSCCGQPALCVAQPGGHQTAWRQPMIVSECIRRGLHVGAVGTAAGACAAPATPACRRHAGGRAAMYAGAPPCQCVRGASATCPRTSIWLAAPRLATEALRV